MRAIASVKWNETPSNQPKAAVSTTNTCKRAGQVGRIGSITNRGTGSSLLVPLSGKCNGAGSLATSRPVTLNEYRVLSATALLRTSWALIASLPFLFFRIDDDARGHHDHHALGLAPIAGILHQPVQ